MSWHKVVGGIAMTLGILNGCGVVPAKVTYSQYPDDSAAAVPTSAYPFRHRRSILLITQDEKTNLIKVEPAPSELLANGSYSPLILVAGVDNLRSTTQIKVSYIANTKLIDELQSTTKDNVADTINKVGAVATALLPLVASAAAGQDKQLQAAAFKPTTLDPMESNVEQWHADAINKNYCLRLREKSTEQGTTLASYLSARTSQHANDFPVPSCSTAILDVAECTNGNPDSISETNIRTQRVTYASATNVTPLPLPSTGSVKMNTVCGANVTEADKQDRTDVLTYLNTIITNVKNIQAAKEKKK